MYLTGGHLTVFAFYLELPSLGGLAIAVYQVLTKNAIAGVTMVAQTKAYSVICRHVLVSTTNHIGSAIAHTVVCNIY